MSQMVSQMESQIILDKDPKKIIFTWCSIPSYPIDQNKKKEKIEGLIRRITYFQILQQQLQTYDMQNIYAMLTDKITRYVYQLSGPTFLELTWNSNVIQFNLLQKSFLTAIMLKQWKVNIKTDKAAYDNMIPEIQMAYQVTLPSFDDLMLQLVCLQQIDKYVF